MNDLIAARLRIVQLKHQMEEINAAIHEDEII